MQLPINARKAPFKEKYIDEETALLRRWFVFGSSAVGTVDIADRDSDVFVGLTLQQAVRIVELRKTFIDGILKVLNDGD